MTIQYYAKHVYGLEKFYIADEETDLAFFALTGRKTLSECDILALDKLGIKCEEVMKPRV